MSDRKPVALFLCGGNSCRSQMGEAFLRRLGGDRFEAASAGLEPAGEIHPMTRRVMAEAGYDLAGHRSKGVDEFHGGLLIEHLVAVCDAAARNCPATWPGMRHRLRWPFPDPAAFEGSEEETLEEFREVRDAIEARVIQWLSEQR